jgi:hypothetical protein
VPAADANAHSSCQRQHAFWDCPVAAAVRLQVQQRLPAGIQLQQHHVWLLQPPSAVVQPAPWAVIAMAAVEAMSLGRRRLWALSQQQGVADPVATASQDATRRFWILLLDFARGGRRAVARGPDGEERPWRGWSGVGPHHPLLAVRNGVVSVRLPE